MSCTKKFEVFRFLEIFVKIRVFGFQNFYKLLQNLLSARMKKVGKKMVQNSVLNLVQNLIQNFVQNLVQNSAQNSVQS